MTFPDSSAPFPEGFLSCSLTPTWGAHFNSNGPLHKIDSVINVRRAPGGVRDQTKEPPGLTGV